MLDSCWKNVPHNTATKVIERTYGVSVGRPESDSDWEWWAWGLGTGGACGSATTELLAMDAAAKWLDGFTAHIVNRNGE